MSGAFIPNTLSLDLDGSMGEVIHHGNITTDGNGFFNITFTAPVNFTTLTATFKADFSDSRGGDGEWEVVMPYYSPLYVGSMVPFDPEMIIAVDSFGLGFVAEFSISRSGQDGQWGSLLLLPIDPSIQEDEVMAEILIDDNLGWMSFNSGELDPKIPFTGTGFDFMVGVPGFFPEDHNFVIAAGMFVDDESFMGGIRVGITVVDNEGNPAFGTHEDPLQVATDAPDSIFSEDEVPVTVTITGSPPVEGADVTIEVTGAGESDAGAGTTDSNGEVSFTLTAYNATDENKTLTLWVNATKDGYNAGNYSKVITVEAWITPKDMQLETTLPDELDSDKSKPFTITVTGDDEQPLPGVYVIFETTGSGYTCKEEATADENGQIHCNVNGYNVTGENSQLTVYLNGTKDGYNPVHYLKQITIIAWNEPNTDEDLTLSTNLPEELDSEEAIAMTITALSGGPVPGVEITLQTSGPGHTCKSHGTTNSNGQEFCALSADTVVGEDKILTLYINGTKEGYKDAHYVKEVIIRGSEPPVPETVIGPILADIGGGSFANVTAGVKGNVTLSVQAGVQPDQDDPNAIGIYLDITKTGDGIITWVFMKVSFTDIPGGIDPTKLKMYFWDENDGRWIRIVTSGVNTVDKFVWANVTHLTVFAPRQPTPEEEDTIPPEITHTPIADAEKDTEITIIAAITDVGDGVQSATLYYHNNGDPGYAHIEMTKVGESYRATIPSSITIKDVEYYIQATDGTNMVTHPADSTSPHKIDVKDAEDEDSDGFIPGFEVMFIIVSLALALLIRKR